MALAHGCEPGRLRLIRGEAGTGKTLVAARLAAVYRRADWQVVGLTPTGAGLDALRDAGLPGGRTLRQFTRDRGTGRLQLDPGTVVVLDDAGRLGGREAGELLADIEASGAKLIALMDGGLQGPLEAGPVLRAVETRVGSARLEDMHWRTAERAEALRLVAAGDARGVEMLRETEVIHGGGTLRGAAAAVALRYLTDGWDDKIALAWSRAEADLLTRAIRAGLDELHPFRAGFEPETGGAFAGLKPGDRIRFIAAGRWQKDRPGRHAPPRIRAGETAQLVGRDGGRLRLRIEGRSPQTGRMDVRDVLYAPNSELPDWRFAFAGTIHGEMGRARDSVHLLAAPGLNLHLLDLTVTVPCAAARVGEVMGRILRRTASAPSVIDYGFDASLGAREALRGQVYQEAAGGTGMARAVARLRDLAGLAGDPGAAARVLPRGLEGAVLAEVIGAAILHDGAAPEGEDRLAVERVVRDMSDARAWRRVLRRVPSTLPGAADDLAAAVAGRDGAGRLLTPARILARGALTAQAMGEDRVAALFERGLGLYGKRAGAARLLGRPEDLVAPQRDTRTEFAWPDRGLRPERGRSAVIGPPRGRPRQRWRLDIGRLLGDVPRADTIMAEQVLEGLAGMFGLGPRAGRARRPGQHAAGRYAAWQAAERSGGGGYAIRAGAGRHAEQVPEANRVVAPHPEPVSGPELHTGRVDAEADLASPVSDYTDGATTRIVRAHQAEMAVEYAGVALQMACALTDRIPADSKVHQLPLPADIARMLKKADACSDLPQEKVNTIAHARLQRTGRRLKARSPLPGNWLPATSRSERMPRARILFMNICLSRNSERTVDLTRTGSIRCA